MPCGRQLETLGFTRKQQPDWFGENADEILELIAAKRKAHDAHLANPGSMDAKNRWHQLRAETQRTLRRLQNDWWTQKSREIQHLADTGDMHHFYDALKSVHGPTRRGVTPVRSEDGSTLYKDKDQILRRWAEHFKSLLNTVNPCDPSVVDLLSSLPAILKLDEAPTFQEVSRAIKTLKNNKSVGSDKIPGEVLKDGGYLLHRHL